MVRLVLIEGLPGTGKSTLARGLCEVIRSNGLEANWYLEEEADHPVHPATFRQARNEPAFAKRCLDSWHHFVERVGTSGGLHLLEGSALQSTVRFMMEQGHATVDEYFQRFIEIIKPLSPGLIYLCPDNALEHSRRVSAHRGADWSCKVSTYLQETPYSTARNWKGELGMHSFWSDYAARCNELVKRDGMPILTLTAEPGDARSQLSESIAFLRGADVRLREIWKTA
ncbi:hypothetical protein QTH90_30550 [Variovorax sp. J2P1-59]|uniref:hypothetical protein n=1 Tax=Variovorax flavidus TaxID=3053501 RepID=UPI0025781BB6|nr:hypothetical protein [Variovorax sp. J2P1-59]MDM0078782.1 hypothetical protein [Variovorax sp. J2P1-59]